MTNGRGISSAQRRKSMRMKMVIGALVVLGLATTLVLNALDDTLMFFVSPKDVTAEMAGSDQRFRLGGLVEEGSIERSSADLEMTFRVTDYDATIPVVYRGLVPDLFAENQGVIAEGYLRADGIFVADKVLAKHDENYMPPEVAAALEEAGHPGDVARPDGESQ